MLEPTLAKVLYYWAIFIVVNDQMLKTYQAIWSLWLNVLNIFLRIIRFRRGRIVDRIDREMKTMNKFYFTFFPFRSIIIPAVIT